MLARLVSLPVSLLMWPFRVAEHRRLMGELGAMDDRGLADIGLTRQDLRDATALPLDADPTCALAQKAAERAQRARRWNRPPPSRDGGGIMPTARRRDLRATPPYGAGGGRLGDIKGLSGLRIPFLGLFRLISALDFRPACKNARNVAQLAAGAAANGRKTEGVQVRRVLCRIARPPLTGLEALRGCDFGIAATGGGTFHLQLASWRAVWGRS